MRSWVFLAGCTFGFLGSWSRGAHAQGPTTESAPGVTAPATTQPPTVAANPETTTPVEPVVAPPLPASVPETTTSDAPVTDSGEQPPLGLVEPAPASAGPTKMVAIDEQRADERTGGDDEPAGPTEPPLMEIRMRVIGGFQHEKEDQAPEAEYGFQLRQVRTAFQLRWKKRWYTRASVDFADGIDPGNGIPYLRTAVLEYRHSKKLRFTLGRFKRPFSYLELQSTGDLPILNRGLLNDLVIEDGAWGDRGIGAMVSGKYKPAKLAWKFSITNPAPDNLTTAGLDTIARVQWKPLDLLQFGIHGGNKFLEFDEGRKHFQAVGADVTLRVGGFEWQVEGMVADQPWRSTVVSDAGLAYGGTTFMSYTQPLTKHLKLVPVVFAEYADANSAYGRNESVQLQGGLNLVIRDQFRIMPQVRMIRALGEPLRSAPPSSPEFTAINPWDDGTRVSLYFSLAL
jgi:hypothetical protein